MLALESALLQSENCVEAFALGDSPVADAQKQSASLDCAPRFEHRPPRNEFNSAQSDVFIDLHGGAFYEQVAMSEPTPTVPLFSPAEQTQFDASIRELLSHYPNERKSAAMLPALRVLQTMKGWLPPEGMAQVAKRLETTVAHCYEVATFYIMFHTKKPGKYVIDVCTNLSCALRGAEGMLRYMEKKLGVTAGEQTDLIFLRETECLASCGTAPCLQVNEDHYENLTQPKLDSILEKLT